MRKTYFLIAITVIYSHFASAQKLDKVLEFGGAKYTYNDNKELTITANVRNKLDKTITSIEYFVMWGKPENYLAPSIKRIIKQEIPPNKIIGIVVKVPEAKEYGKPSGFYPIWARYSDGSIREL